ncbi:ferredoxin [Streptomyces sp. 8N114]|uniref:ferredoxin n=1 Tax=Streptomyces sp. 8N114 TaxID=3457419 RepID=UPI003FD52FE9
MSLKIVADRGACIGSGLCALNAPEIFDQHDEDGTVHVLVEHPPADQHDLVDQAIQSCPAHALGTAEQPVT